MAKANEILLKLTAENDQLKAKLNETEKNINNFANKSTTSLGKLQSIVTKVGAAIGVAFAVRVTKAMIDTGKEISNISNGFKNLAQNAEGGADGLLKAMKKASKGTIAEMDIMKSANLALQLMGDDVAANLPKMTEIAAGIAKAQGKNTAEMLNDIVVAAGRQSVMILDNLGISSVRAGQLIEEYANKLGKTRDQLTDSEKAAAFFYATMKAGEEALQRSGGVVDDYATRIARLKAKTTDLADATSRLLVPIFEKFVSLLTKLIDSMQNAIDEYNEFSELVDTGKVDVAGQWAKEAIESSKWWQENYKIQEKLYSDKYGWEQKYQQLLQKGYTDEEIRAKKREIIAKGLYEKFYQLSYEQQKQAILGVQKKTGKAITPKVSPVGTEVSEKDIINYSKEFSDTAIKVAESFEKIRQYAMAGDLEATAKAMQELQKQGLLSADSNSQFAQSMQEIAYNATIQNYAVDTLSTAFTNLDNASRDAVYEMLWGKNGWSNFLKNFKEIVKQLVAEIVYLTVKAMALQAVLSAVGIFGFGGGGVGARVLSKIFERGYIPSYARGKIPAFPTGYVPNDHFLAYIGTKEAVVRKEATQANRDILAWMNANNGQRYQNDILLTSIVQIDGNEVGRAVDKYRDKVQSLTGLQNYSRKQL